MKKFLVFTLLLTLCLTLAVSCSREAGNTMSGVYKANGETYAFIDGGVVIYDAGLARFATYSVDGDNVVIGDKTIAKSELAASSLEYHGDAVNAAYFVTSNVGGVKTLIGLTEEGKAQTALVIPKDVKDIAEGALEGSSVKAIVIPEGFSLNLSSGSLKNGGSLAVLISGSIAPGTALTCGNSLLDGTSGVTFYIEKEALSTYKSHYTWGNFKDSMKGL